MPASSDTAAVALLSAGEHLRLERERQGMSLRELARRIGVSASLVSQIERGKVRPSVGTLYAIVSELGLSMDAVFDDGARNGDGALAPAAASAVRTAATASGPLRVQREQDRQVIHLSSGVRWERLTPDQDGRVDFLHVVYEPGAESCEPTALMRHSGREYGYVQSGRLGVTIGFEQFELGPGDSIAFESTTPHRLWTIGEEPVHAVWTVIGRNDDARGED
jgi:transcriptional regulator with XRE-family HTH domain